MIKTLNITIFTDSETSSSALFLSPCSTKIIKKTPKNQENGTFITFRAIMFLF